MNENRSIKNKELLESNPFNFPFFGRYFFRKPEKLSLETSKIAFSENVDFKS